MKSYADVIVRPLITEKSMDGVAGKRYSFEVRPDATKADVAAAVETMFKKTKVAKVNIINMKKTHIKGILYKKKNNFYYKNRK